MKRTAWLLLLAAVATFCVGPFVVQVLASLGSEADVARGGLPLRPSLHNFALVFRERPLAHVMMNSLVVALGTTVLSLGLGSTGAFALAKLPVPGRPLLLAGVLSVSMFPPIATVSPLFLLLRSLGLLDTRWGLIVPYTTFALPLTLWVLTSFFRELPEELYLAARVDGCSPLGAFWRVMLPLAVPGLATTALLVFVFSWNEFLYALTFTTSPAQRTIPVAISLFAGAHTEPWAEIAAASVAVTLPLLVLTLLFQRQIVSGLTAGAVKG